MHVTGLITEYNPFHNGHLYHIKKAREAAGADYVVALMSGSFVQRGAPAVFDKYSRARAALSCGADLVVELPAPFSTASAREFAGFSIALFTALGAVDSVCFGSECGEIEPLKRAAAILDREPGEFKEALKAALREGKTFPQARCLALQKAAAAEGGLSSQAPLASFSSLLSSPNNILGVEYCQAVLRQNSPFSCLTIRREGNGYHDPSIAGELGSALAVRTALEAGADPSLLAGLVPPCTLDALRRKIPVFLNDFSSILNYRLLTEPHPEAYADFRPELAARLKGLPPSFASFEEHIRRLKSRQLTYTGVSRALLHLVLAIPSELMEEFKAAGYAPYARILGFKKSAGPLLKRIKQNSSIPVFTKVAGAQKRLSRAGAAMLECEIRASHIYQAVRMEKAARGEAPGKSAAFQNEYTEQVAAEE